MSVSSSSHWNNLEECTLVWLEKISHQSLPRNEDMNNIFADGKILAVVADRILDLQANSGSNNERNSVSMAGSKADWSKFKNFEIFSKVCKLLGVSEQDLVTPTDIIHKRDAKRVCLCLRALATRARESKIDVPEFLFEEDNSGSSGDQGGLVATVRKWFDTSPESPIPSGDKPASLPAVSHKSKGLNFSSQESESEAASTSVLRAHSEPASTVPGKAVSELPPGKASVSKSQKGFPLVAASLVTSAVAVVCLFLFTQQQRRREVYLVQGGDTLADIARKTGRHHWRDVYRKNREAIEDPDKIFPQQKILL